MSVNLKTLTLTDIAKIGLALDDPHGDGIRLDEIRNPSAARLAALAEVAGEPVFFGEELIREAYTDVVMDPEIWTAKGNPSWWLKQRLEKYN